MNLLSLSKNFIKNNNEALLNLFFRGVAILCKFLMVFYILYKSNTSELGNYNIFSANIAIASLILGFEFYNHSVREIIRCPEIKRLSLIKDQFIIHILFYLTFYIIFKSFDLEKYILFFNFFLWISILESINQQFFLILISLGKSTISSFQFFLRNALWFIIFVIVDFFNGQLDFQLTNFFTYWIFGLIVSLIYSFYYVIKYLDFKLFKFDFKYIKSGLKVSMVYIGGACVYKLYELGDRYIIDFFLDKSYVGLFTFFMGIAAILPVIIYNTVIIIESPIIIKNIKLPNQIKYYNKLIDKSKLILKSSSIVLVCILPFALYFLSNDQISNNFGIIMILIPALYFNSLQTITTAFLHATNQDNFIQKSIIFAFIINIVLSISCINFIGIYACAISNLCSSYFLYKYKENYLQKILK